MLHAKQASSKRKRSIYAVPVLSAAVGLSLSLASGASAAIGRPAADALTPKTATSHEIILCEEKISDVNLATSYVFDNDRAGNSRCSARLAQGGCAIGMVLGSDEGCSSCSTSTSIAWPAGRYSNPPSYRTKTARKFAIATKRRHVPQRRRQVDV
jgi:hypothetical protein